MCESRLAESRWQSLAGTRRIQRAAVVVVLVMSLGAGRSMAGFAPALRVTDGSGKATQTATGLDLANNAYISSVIDEKIRVKIIGPSVNVDAPIDAAGVGQGDPDFATNSRAVTYMSFSQLDPRFPGEGREIFIVNNDGGRFLEPVRITSNRVDDFAPRLALDRDGAPHLAWARRMSEETQVFYWNQTLEPEQEFLVARGDYPAIFVDAERVVHVVYMRDNDLYYNYSGYGAAGVLFDNESKVSTTPFEPESSVSIGVDPSGRVLLCYESKNSLYFQSREPGSAEFEPPRLLDRGGVLQPEMRVRREGQVTIVYAKEGDIYYIQGQGTSLNQPKLIFGQETEEVESYPSIDVDLSNNVHVSFIRDGEVWYTNNATEPQADFSALPTSGEVPMKVQFADLSSGDIQVWEWDFGDGTTSPQQSPVHTYLESGKYTVSLKVAGPGAVENTKEREDFIFVQDPYNTLEIPDQLVIPSQKDVWFPVLATHKEPIKAFQLMGLYDSNVLTLQRYELDFTVIQALDPELLVMNDHGTYFEIGCIFDFEEPFNKEPLQGGDRQTLINLIFDVSPGAPQGATTRVSLTNDRELSPIINIFTVGGFSRVPKLKPSTVKILVVEPPYPKFFLRGDADGNMKVDITDAIRILNYLFLGGIEPTCMDAADFSDSGKVDISAAIGLLNYLFLGGSQPAVPFPMPGLDPTEDSQPQC